MANAKCAYRELLKRVDDIGSNNPMASNLYFVMGFMSFHVGNPEIIGGEEMEGIIDDFYRNRMIRRLLSMFNLNKEGHFTRFKNAMKKNSRWIEKRRDKYPFSWDFDFETTHRDGIYYQFTICPIAKFMKENGYEEFTELFCNIDYRNFTLMHGNLYREYTIARDGTICDFWIAPDEIDDPQ